MNKLGKVYLVGAGCGDYDLITLRGMNLLKVCDTVVYDSLIDSRLLDFTADTTEKNLRRQTCRTSLRKTGTDKRNTR